MYIYIWLFWDTAKYHNNTLESEMIYYMPHKSDKIDQIPDFEPHNDTLYGALIGMLWDVYIMII